MDKQQFFLAAARPTAKVDVLGFGEVTIRALNIEQRLSLTERFNEDQARTSAWIVAVAVDGLTEEDIDDILEMDTAVISKIGDAVLSLSGMGDDEEGDAKNG